MSKAKKPSKEAKQQTPFWHQLITQYILYSFIWCVSSACFGVCATLSGRTTTPVPWKTKYYYDIVIYCFNSVAYMSWT